MVLPQRGALANAREAVAGDRRAAALRREVMLTAAGDAARRAAPVPGERGTCLGRGGPAAAWAGMSELAGQGEFRAAAEEVLAGVQERLGLELWVLVALDTAGPADGDGVLAEWSGPGACLPLVGMGVWARAVCRLILAGRAPRVAARAGELVEALRLTAPGLRPAAYVGVPLLAPDGTAVGVLCGVSGREQPDTLRSGLGEAERAARLLAALLSAQRALRERARVMAEAYDLAERDPLTGLVNRRGWQARLAVEEQRCHRYQRPASVLVIDLTAGTCSLGAPAQPGQPGQLRDAARLLTQACRSVDVLARPDVGQLSVLAVECPAGPAADLAHRVCGLLLDAGLSPAVGVAPRSRQHGLLDAWDEAMEQAQHQRRA